MLFRPEKWSFKNVQNIEIWKNAIFSTFLTSCSDSLKKLFSFLDILQHIFLADFD